ncbi:MAG: hypothetical protein B7Y76_10820, partial [Sphingobacteriia bacterium 35-40-5]
SGICMSNKITAGDTGRECSKKVTAEEKSSTMYPRINYTFVLRWIQRNKIWIKARFKYWPN